MPTRNTPDNNAEYDFTLREQTGSLHDVDSLDSLRMSDADRIAEARADIADATEQLEALNEAIANGTARADAKEEQTRLLGIILSAEVDLGDIYFPDDVQREP